jgi:hypothetical protein
MSQSTKRRVFQVSTGNVGSEMVSRLRDHPDLEYAVEIVVIEPLGVLATGTVEEIIASGPDCVNFNGVWSDMDLFVAVLEAGINGVDGGLDHQPPPEPSAPLREQAHRGDRGSLSKGRLDLLRHRHEPGPGQHPLGGEHR